MDFVERTALPIPWAEGDNIPWNDPGFSGRMLEEHLSQKHNAASRRFERIDTHVAWIQKELVAKPSSRILDLGCGPGFYTHRLAALGHGCTGIDYSPASIAYAMDRARGAGLDLTYLEGDIRHTDFGEGFDLAMLIFGELNVFSRPDANHLLAKAYAALRPGGRLLLEAHTAVAVEERGRAPASWYSSPSGLFSSQPHLVLQENFWDEGTQSATTRYFVMDAQTHRITPYASSVQAYQESEYRSLLQASGFDPIQTYSDLSGDPAIEPDGFGLSVWVAKRPG